MFTDEYQKMLHARSINNRGALLDSRECGCFFCIKMFTPDKITDWINEETARCPFCTASAFGTKRSRVCGAETEYFDLYDLNFTGCRSCLLCKRKDGERCKCFWKDDLAPIIEKVFASDALFVGSPIYLRDTTSQLHAFLERLHFCALSYDDYRNYFTGKVNVGIVLTMNAPQVYYIMSYEKKLKDQINAFRSLNGEVRVLTGCDTRQVKDYSKYNMASFNEKHKIAHHEKQFPLDLDKAFKMGAELCCAETARA